MKKEKDGYYYKKEVSWRKKPNYFFRFLSIVFIIIFILYIKVGIKEENQDQTNIMIMFNTGQLTGFQFLNFLLGSILTIVITLIGSILFLILSLGNGRKVKFKRIGK